MSLCHPAHKIKPAVKNRFGILALCRVVPQQRTCYNSKQGPDQRAAFEAWEDFDEYGQDCQSLEKKADQKGYTVFAYVITGQGYFEPERDPYGYELEGINYFDFKRDCLMGPGNLIMYDDGDKLAITTEDESVRFLLVSGRSIKEPIAWHGPIVMNTREEFARRL